MQLVSHGCVKAQARPLTRVATRMPYVHVMWSYVIQYSAFLEIHVRLFTNILRSWLIIVRQMYCYST